jgi:hypothetical protein
MQSATSKLTGDGQEARAEAIDVTGINSPEQARAKLEELGLGYETEVFLEELRHGWEDSFHLYMLAGMDVEAKGANGVTPLLAAVFGNNPAIVKETSLKRPACITQHREIPLRGCEAGA